MTTPTIRAIETTYKGYRFRSRLEARWAVVLDKLNLAWEYEPQGYRLSNGSAYLPDFYLPEKDWWVEVKGSEDGLDWERLWSAAEERPILLLGPIPERDLDGRRFAVVHPALAHWRGDRATIWVQLHKHSSGGKGCLHQIPPPLPVEHITARRIFSDCTPWSAYDAGRQARFEHGETPS